MIASPAKSNPSRITFGRVFMIVLLVSLAILGFNHYLLRQNNRDYIERINVLSIQLQKQRVDRTLGDKQLEKFRDRMRAEMQRVLEINTALETCKSDSQGLKTSFEKCQKEMQENKNEVSLKIDEQDQSTEKCSSEIQKRDNKIEKLKEQLATCNSQEGKPPRQDKNLSDEVKSTKAFSPKPTQKAEPSFKKDAQDESRQDGKTKEIKDPPKEDKKDLKGKKPGETQKEEYYDDEYENKVEKKKGGKGEKGEAAKLDGSFGKKVEGGRAKEDKKRGEEVTDVTVGKGPTTETPGGKSGKLKNTGESNKAEGDRYKEIRGGGKNFGNKGEGNAQGWLGALKKNNLESQLAPKGVVLAPKGQKE